jgi:hypothetical protein
MEDIDEKKRVWGAIYQREQDRRQNIDELKRIVDEMGEGKKTAKTLLKLVVYTEGIRAQEAADIIGVRRQVIDGWLKLLMDRDFVEIESSSHPNPTIRPTKEIMERFRAYKQRKGQEMGRMDEGIKGLGEKAEGLGGETQPSPDDEKPDEVVPELETGVTYMVFEPKSEKSMKLFIRDIRNVLKGLYITRSNPNHVKKRHYLADSKVVWLTSVQTGREFESISGLQEMSILVSKFIDENGSTVILLEGLEYLISNNSFQVVLRLIQQLRDKVSTSNSKMIIPLNPNALEDKQLSLLEGECQTLEE